MRERLDKRLARAAVLTRTQAQRAIRAGEVEVNTAVVCDPAAKIGDADAIAWRGMALATSAPRYLMLNKPAGYVCAHEDTYHPSALSLIDLPGRDRLHFAGRLDADTTGLVLVTDDGDWSHRITSPRRDCLKVYRVALAESLHAEAERRLVEGVLLHGEKRPTRPVRIERLGEREVRLAVGEGKYHQVKRMFAAVGNRVVTLHREAIGPIVLDPALAPGAWRELTGTEITSTMPRLP